MREEQIVNLLGQLHDRARQQPASKNTVLQKFTAPTDSATLEDTVEMTLVTRPCRWNQGKWNAMVWEG